MGIEGVDIANKLFPKETGEIPYEIGTAVVVVSGFEKQLLLNPSLVSEQFTSEERLHCEDKPEKLAGRHAGKIAISQVLRYLNPHDVSIEPLSSGQPAVRLSGWAEHSAGPKRIHISIAHDADLAAAMVLSSPQNLPSPGIGLDIASVDRITEASGKHGDRFLKRQYTQSEIDESSGDMEILTEKWAGKEALAKALGTGFWRDGVAFTDVEIIGSEANLTGGALARARELGYSSWRIHIQRSVSDTIVSYAIIY